MTAAGQDSLETLEARLRDILPPEYQETYENVQPVSMGSAVLKFALDGTVAWDRIWNTFCDLAMAGGPPHKGMLLEPGTPADIAAQRDRYREVVDEICRGIQLAAGLASEPSPSPGWIGIPCNEPGMAEWLTRAIVMENVSARFAGNLLQVPAGPNYRVEKEIKNVITSVAKTSHYWLAHTLPSQSRRIADLFGQMSAAAPLVQSALPDAAHPAEEHQRTREVMGQALHQQTGLPVARLQYDGWFGLECPNPHAAIWIMRALVVSNVLARREGNTLFVAVNPAVDPEGQSVIQRLARVHGFAVTRKIL